MIINILKKIPTAFLFSLVVFSLLFSPFSHEAAPGKEIKKENTLAKKDKKTSSEEVIAPLRAIEAVIPFTQPDLLLDLYFITERKFKVITKDYISFNLPHYINVYFKNLFSYVICVNAP